MIKEDFIILASNKHNNKYNYDNIDFVNCNIKIKILCPDHGIFEQRPVDHLNGDQCYKCSNMVRTTDDFIIKANEIHNNIYDYSKVNYTKSHNKIIIICKNHGEFKQTANVHLKGIGCKKCSTSGYSKICIKWLEEIMFKENIFIEHAGNIGEKTVNINNKICRFDGYCKTNNTVYELYGDFFHGNPKIYKNNDINPLIKKSFGELYENTIEREYIIKNAGYNLITIWESDFKK